MSDNIIPLPDNLGARKFSNSKSIDIGDVDKYFESYANFLRVLRLERGQLYGTVVRLLLDMEYKDGDSFVIGDLDDMMYIAENYHASFSANDEGNLIVTLHYHGDKNE